MGIDTGVVVVSETVAGAGRQSLAFGDTVNIAARLEKLAKPGMVVVSSATERVTRGYFSFTAIEAVRVKGVVEPITVYRVDDDTGVRTRIALSATTDGLTPLVGRERELAAMRERWGLALQGQGQATLVTGEPGIGKSRVVHELGNRVGAEGTRLVFQASRRHTRARFIPSWRSSNGHLRSTARRSRAMELHASRRSSTRAESQPRRHATRSRGCFHSTSKPTPRSNSRPKNRNDRPSARSGL